MSTARAAPSGIRNSMVHPDIWKAGISVLQEVGSP
jgi:hypothetical protein